MNLDIGLADLSPEAQKALTHGGKQAMVFHNWVPPLEQASVSIVRNSNEIIRIAISEAVERNWPVGRNEILMKMENEVLHWYQNTQEGDPAGVLTAMLGM